MSGINHNDPFFMLNSKRMIKDVPAKEVVKEALEEKVDISSSPSFADETDTDIVFAEDIDQQLLLGMKNIKIISSVKDTL